MIPHTILRDKENMFVITDKDKIVTEIPSNYDFVQEYKCDSFIVWRRRKGVMRCYMLNTQMPLKYVEK